MSSEVKRGIAVLTSGGDSCGMNASVRAVVRAASHYGIEVYGIMEGYLGLVNNDMRLLSWDDVGGILHQGGTLLGSSRCPEFRTEEGRRRAVQNLLTRDIDRIVVIGGDGSLTGAVILKDEWLTHISALVALGTVPSDSATRHLRLSVVGLPGSIDNDIAGSMSSIGADTALTRVVEAVDCINSTASSHRRTFIVEIMGRRCGWLALMGAICTGADYVMIPEVPQPKNWRELMCHGLDDSRHEGLRRSLVLVCEGALDVDGEPITSEEVKVACDKHGMDTRVSILGHVQRGGVPSCFDRIMSSLSGWLALEKLLLDDGKSYFVGSNGALDVDSIPLDECLQRTLAVAAAYKEKQLDKLMSMRGEQFQEYSRLFMDHLSCQPHSRLSHPTPPPSHVKRVAIIHIGAMAPGMNQAVRTACRMLQNQGHEVWGILNGVDGWVENRLVELNWSLVMPWVSKGGAELGARRFDWQNDLTSERLQAMAVTLSDRKIDAIIMVGGFHGLQVVTHLWEARTQHPEFAIPWICLPATISNNIPGTDITIGSDTALNTITHGLDQIKVSARAGNRAFVVEVMGARSGFLALMGSLAAGAERAYIPEEGLTLAQLNQDVEWLNRRFTRGPFKVEIDESWRPQLMQSKLALIVRNEAVNKTYTTELIVDVMQEESGGRYEARKAVLGHVQQGGDPSPRDRTLACRMMFAGVEHLFQVMELPVGGGTDRAGWEKVAAPHLACIRGDRLVVEPMSTCYQPWVLGGKRCQEQSWLKCRHISQVLSEAPTGMFG